MNVLYAATAYPPAVGGAQIHLHSMAKSVQALGHDVQVVCHWSNNRTDWIRGATVFAGPAREYDWEGVPVSQLGYGRLTKAAMLPLVCAYPALVRPAAQGIARLMRSYFETAAGLPDVVHVSRIGREFLARAAYDFARQRDIPFVLTPNHHPRWHGHLYQEYDFLYRSADAVIALTEEEKRCLAEQKGVDPARIHIRPIGPVLSSTYSAGDFRKRHGLEDTRFVLYLGQQYKYKGPGALLDAAPIVWKKHPDVRFVFVGPKTDYSRKRFGEVRDERILNLGAVDLEEKTSALAACDLMCLPSAQESFGGVYVEAWAMGKAVIGGRIGPIECVVDEGVNGLLATQAPDVLANALVQLLDDPATCQAMGEAGRRKVDDQYAWPSLAARNIALYESLCERGPKSTGPQD